jgi:REP element-mobilizing transposase RayT
MEIYPNTYYHIYNSSNNTEAVFRSRDNYGFFLTKYRHHCAPYLNTLAYCLMPTHFHLLVYVHSTDTDAARKQFGIVLSSYTQAFNKRYKRHGSLFQAGTKAKVVRDSTYLATLAAYIHNNPVRSRLVARPEEWEFSSYQEYCGLRKGTLPDTALILSSFQGVEEFRVFSEGIVAVERAVWV